MERWSWSNVSCEKQGKEDTDGEQKYYSEQETSNQAVDLCEIESQDQEWLPKLRLILDRDVIENKNQPFHSHIAGKGAHYRT